MKKGKIVILLTIAVVISFFISTTFSFVSIAKLVRRNDKEEATIIANQITSSIGDSFLEPLAVSQSLNSTYLKDVCMDIDEYTIEEKSDIIGHYLRDIINTFGYDTGFFCDKKNYEYYSESGYVKTLDLTNDDDDWFMKFIRSGKPYELNVDNDQSNDNRITAFINVLMKDDDNNVIGVCGVGLTLNSIDSLIHTISDQYNMQICLIDGNGVVQVGTSNYIPNVPATDMATYMIFDYHENEMKGIYSIREDDTYYFLDYLQICDWYLFVEDTVNISDSSTSLIIRNIIACCATLICVISIIVAYLKFEDKREKELKLKSEVDGLTGDKNRMAYESKLSELRELTDISQITVFVFDLNQLKYINDTYGHSEGDKAIVNASKCIRFAFTDVGDVYKTGGDEFVVICFDKINKDEIVNNVLVNVRDLNSANEVKFTLSYGYASGSENLFINYDEIFKSADKRMYDCKNKYYRENGFRR